MAQDSLYFTNQEELDLSSGTMMAIVFQMSDMKINHP